jgi:hypothetical protein
MHWRVAYPEGVYWSTERLIEFAAPRSRRISISDSVGRYRRPVGGVFDATGMTQSGPCGDPHASVLASIDPYGTSVRGVTVEGLGFGTAWLTSEDCRNTVEYAPDICYQYIDTARYDNETAVGD